MLFISAISTGILLASVSKKSSTVQLIGLSILFLTITLGGYFVPIAVIGGVDAIKYISLFSPINFATSLLNNTLIKPIDGISQSIFDISNFNILSVDPRDPAITIIAGWQKVLNLIMPTLIFGGFNFIAYKKFSWSSR